MLLYVHIPFCSGKCLYCDFYSIVANSTIIDSYIDGLEREAQLVREKYFDSTEITLETIYIGGGTPTMLTDSQLGRIMRIIDSNFRTYKLKEFSCEVNPESVSADKLAVLQSSGLNRISIGAQTFDDALLKVIGRRHSSAQIQRAYELAHKFTDNINLDLIFGLPYQIIDNLKTDLHRVAETLSAAHLACYELTFSEGTKLTEMLNHSHIPTPDEDLLVEMHRYVHRFLTANGYEHYEISNYAKPTRQCLHNLRYWENAEYIGLGASAAGYINGVRYKNCSDVDQYCRKLSDNILSIESSETLSKKSRAGETAMLALRTSAGIDREKFKNQTGYDPFLLFANQIEKFRNTHLLEVDERTIKLTPEGFLLSNEILREFLL